MDYIKLFEEKRKIVLEETTLSLNKINEKEINDLIVLINKSNKIFFIGVGRVMLMLSAFAKRLNHLGYDCHIVGEIVEPPINKGDLLIVGSGSGNTLIPKGIARKAKELGANIAHIGINKENPLKEITDVFVSIPVKGKTFNEDSVDSKQPMTSLFEQSILLLADTLAMVLSESKKEELGDNLWNYHANLE